MTRSRTLILTWTWLVAAGCLSLCGCGGAAFGDDDDNDFSEKLRIPRSQGTQAGVPEPGTARLAPPAEDDSQRLPAPVMQPDDTQEMPPQRDPRLTLNRQQARIYMVELINKDRATEHLPPVILDMVASEAGQAHTEEMVANGYHGHWGMDGKKPPERYTEGGGRDYDMENAWFSGFKEGGKAKPDQDPYFSKEELEKAEYTFISEKPPMDGHRKNILTPQHNGVGICLSRATGHDYHFRMALTQEFINHYGTYAQMPYQATFGDAVTVAGQLYPGFHLHDITVFREDLPKPMTIDELNATYSYPFPPKAAVYFPPPFHSDVPISVTETQQGQQFSLQIPIEKKLGGEGLYSIGIWAIPANDPKPVMVSVRTIEVTKHGHDKSK
jgi:uncharacterized protein YkwD